MNLYETSSLSSAVAAIFPDIRDRVLKNSKPPNEKVLWWELSSCILSSQVPYSLAIAAADAIDGEALLLNGHYDFKGLMQKLFRVLSKPLIVEGRPRRYRFPEARSRHLAATRTIITAKKCSLHNLVYGFENAMEARAWFVKEVPGIGPKQASMFLRNAGVSFDLAILDRHVLKFMSKIGLYPETNFSISGLARYRRHEDALREYAQEVGCQLGFLDWAIWIVMRVANRNIGGAEK